MATTQEIVAKELESMNNAIKREASIKANIFDCDAVLNHIQCMETDGTPIGEESPYKDFNEWKEAVTKEKKGYESQLVTIAEYKELKVAYEWYLENNPGV